MARGMGAQSNRLWYSGSIRIVVVVHNKGPGRAPPYSIEKEPPIYVDGVTVLPRIDVMFIEILMGVLGAVLGLGHGCPYWCDDARGDHLGVVDGNEKPERTINWNGDARGATP